MLLQLASGGIVCAWYFALGLCISVTFLGIHDTLEEGVERVLAGQGFQQGFTDINLRVSQRPCDRNKYFKSFGERNPAIFFLLLPGESDFVECKVQN